MSRPKKREANGAPKPWERGSGEKEEQFERLAKCAKTLIQHDALNADDDLWLAGLLARIAGAEDVRHIFLDPPSRGRRTLEETNDREFWITVDALIETATTGKKGKALHALLADRWGYPDGSIRNAITRQRFYAADLLASMSIEELQDVLPGMRNTFANNNSVN